MTFKAGDAIIARSVIYDITEGSSLPIRTESGKTFHYYDEAEICHDTLDAERVVANELALKIDELWTSIRNRDEKFSTLYKTCREQIGLLKDVGAFITQCMEQKMVHHQIQDGYQELVGKIASMVAVVEK